MDPHPREIDLIFGHEDKARLESLGQVAWHEGSRASDEQIERNLERAVALIGQTPMPRERLARAPRLRAILNVEGNFLPNIDYDECHRRGIKVLSCAPAFAPAVAEMALGLALAAARGIVDGDADFRAGREVYGGASNRRSFLLRGQTMGLIGFGNVGRALAELLRPLAGRLLVHDPWLHPNFLRQQRVEPVSLDELLRQSRGVFVLAAATTENQRGLGAEQFATMPADSVLVLAGRSDTLDFDALLDAAASGRLRVAIDVFPQEPLPADHRARKTPNTILSAHRAGGIPETYREIGRMVVDDLELILRGLPPQRMQEARPEIVSRYRGKPVTK